MSELGDPAVTGAQPPLAVQLGRFVTVGAVSALVDFGLLVGLMAAGLGHNQAKAISFVFGTLAAYVLNRRWTFAAAHSARRLLSVVGLYTLTFALQVGLFALVFPGLDAHWGERSAQVCGFVVAQGVATVVNFVVQRSVIFRR